MNRTMFSDPRGSVLRAAIRIALVSAFVVLLGVVGLSVAEAAARPWALRYELLGDGVKIAQIGNSNMTCSGSNLSNGMSCSDTQAGGGNNDWYNDEYNMIHTNTDGNILTINSSTAELTLPANAVVVKALLYWGGSFSPTDEGNQSDADEMSFRNKDAGNTYQTVTAQFFNTIDVTRSGNTGRAYGASADVTSLFTTPNPDWGSGTYEGADIQATTGCTSGFDCDGTQSGGEGWFGNYAGWALLVVYHDPAEPKVRYVGIQDGFTCVVSIGSGCAGPSLSFNMTGFNLPAGVLQAQRWGLLGWDGDTGTGDGFRMNDVQRSDASHPETNYFQSRISRNGANVPGTERSNGDTRINNLGMDLVESTTGNLAGATTSIPVSFTTGAQSEVVLQHFFWLEVETTDIDFGDDPIAYGVVSHDISTSSSTLFLGVVKPDPETVMQNTGVYATTAEGDNLNGTNDEEGVTFPALKSNVTSYSVTVKATNTTGAAATLYAWIDLNRNNQFDSTEAQLVSIPNGSNGANFNVTWPSFTAIPANTILYARFRLTTQTLTETGGGFDERSTNASTGGNAANNGEVEDYRLNVTAPTAAVLSTFTAKAINKRVDLKWGVANELSVLGYRVTRSNKRGGTYEPVSGLISAKVPGGSSAAQFAFKDRGLTPGKRYFYKLELVGTNGPVETSQPVRVRMAE